MSNKIKMRLLPVITLNDEDKITVTDYEWDGKKDRFVVTIKDQVTMPIVHLRSYRFTKDTIKKQEAIVYLFCDDRISPDQCAEIATNMGPWLYTYGYRSEG